MHLAHPMVLLGPATTRSENYWCTIKFKPVADGDFSDFCPNCENLERHILQQHQCHRCKCGSSWFSAQGETCKTRLAIVALSTKPFQLGPRTKERGEEFGWDCDPLIPISVWVSVLVGHLSLLQKMTFSFGPHIYHLIFQITLFLASILMWGVCMLAYLNTPTKFDDPKGPRYLPEDEIT